MLSNIYGRLTGDDDDSDTIPLRRVPLSQVRPFENCVPALDLKVAAGGFSDVQDEPGNYRWVALPGRTRAAPDLFVAQVLGESMNRRIPSGAWCLWRLHPAGDLNGRIVLAQHRDIADPEHGGSYTVKIFQPAPTAADPEDPQPTQVTLHPASTDPTFTPIVLDDLEEGQLTIIAELVEVLR